MNETKRNNFIAGLALVVIMLIFGSLALGVSPRVVVIATAAIAACGFGAALLRKSCKGGKLKEMARRAVTVAMCLILLGGVVAYAASDLTPSDVSKFNHKNYLTVTASSTDNASVSTVTLNGNNISVSAKSYNAGSDCSPDWKGDTVTVTVTNTSTMEVDFTVAQTGCTLSGVAAAANQRLAANGGKFTFTVTASASESGSASGTVTITNLTTVSTGALVKTTFRPTSGGTFTVDGESITAEKLFENTMDHGYVLKATADTANGYKFFGWYSQATGQLSTSASYTYKGVEGTDDVVWPLFYLDGNAVFSVQKGNFTTCYATLQEAITAVGSSGTIALQQTGILPAGTYTIPSGVTLLIPMNAAHTIYTTTPGYMESTTAVTTAFRTLTMADGAKIVLNGTMSIPAKISVGFGNSNAAGVPVGASGRVIMQGSSNITVNSGAALYCYGHIAGSGTVTALKGSTVYESMEIQDYPGGTVSTSIRNKVFPFNQYYIQNIEVPMTVESGATITAACCFYADDYLVVSLPYIGTSGCMFNLASGTMVKEYDGSTDRQIFTIKGQLNMASVSLDLAGSSLVNSKNFILPITNNLTVIMESGSNMSISQDISMLAGSQLLIREGATVTLNSGYSMYIYDQDEWGGYAVRGGSNKFLPARGPVGRTYTRTEADLVDAMIQVEGTFDASAGSLYTTKSGANICGLDGGVVKTKPGSSTTMQQITAIGNYGSVTYDTITISSAKLRNANDTYVEPASAAAEYQYDHGAWHKVSDCDLKYTETIISAPTCKSPGEASYTCTCKAATYTEEIPAGAHTPGETVVENEVSGTCAVPGSYDNVTYCTVCGSETSRETITLESNAHTPGETVVEKEVKASCTAGGSYDNVTYCTACGTETSRETIPVDPLPHTEIIDSAVAPTCGSSGLTEGKHCSVCGTITVSQTVVDALSHTEKTVPGYAATCTAAGMTDGKVCDLCGETILAQEQIPALEHDYQSEVTTAPTCTADGIRTYTCQRTGCGHSYTEAISSVGHTEVIDNGFAATCTVPGKTEGKHCDVCGEVTVAQQEIPAPGHIEQTVAGKAATCTATGLTEGKVCTREGCGATLTSQEVIPALNHIEQIIPATAPGCTAAGLTEGKVCSRTGCGEILVAQKPVDALGHDEISHDGKASTCTEAGWNAYVTCSRCEYTTYQALPKAEHTYGSGIVTATPSCTKTGIKTFTCSACSDSYTETVDALGHDEVPHEAKSPTCSEIGWDTYVTCTRCDYSTYHELSKTAHTEVTDAAQSPSCTVPGKTEGKHCDVCGEVTVAQQEIPALEHSWNSETGVCSKCQAVCTHPAYSTQLQTCKTCGKGCPHEAYSDPVVTADPGCEADGSQKSTCLACEFVKTEAVPALGHDWEAATCTQPQYCSRCGAQGDAALGHQYKTSVTEPTCTSAGSTVYTCSVCGNSYTGDEVAALGHVEIIDQAKAATCTETGLTEGKHCSRCGNVLKKQEVVAAKGHTNADMVVENTKAASCTAAGSYDNVIYCSVCGEEVSRETITVPAFGHTSGEAKTENIVAAGCTTDGSYDTVTYCTVCGKETSRETTVVKAQGHSWKDATCTAPKTCTLCGFTEGDAEDHSWDNGVVTKESTCTEDGVKTFTCGTCGTTKEQPIYALGGHDYYTRVTKSPSCTEEGEKTHTCITCGESYTEAVEALGHDEVAHEAQAPTCTEIGWDAYVTCSRCDYSTYEEIPATGAHTNATREENRVEATCGEAGSYDLVTYCSACSEVIKTEKQTIAATGNHSYGADGKCTVCGEETVKKDPIVIAHSMQAFLELKSEVIMGVYFSLENVAEDIDPHTLEDRLGLLIWDASPDLTDTNATIENCSYVINSAKYNSTGTFEVLSDGIAAKDLGNALAFRVFYLNDNGEYVYGRLIKSYSPMRYCYNKLADPEMKPLMIAILNYCTAAQKYFESKPEYKYTPEVYINAELTEAEQQMTWDSSLIRSAWSVPEAKEGALTRNKAVVTGRRGSLTLKGAIDYNFEFNVSGITVKTAELLTWTEEAYNACDVLTEENATVYEMSYISSSSQYEYTYAGLAAKDMFSPIYGCAKFTDTEGNVYYSGVVAYCPERYSYINHNNPDSFTADLAKWIVIYGDAARSYFKNR